MSQMKSTTDDGRTRTSDAISQLNRARLGSLVTDAGKPLGVANLTYLHELRNRVFEWSDSIEKEIDRVERLAARESAQPCGCDPGESYTCERHQGSDVTR